MMTKLKGRHDFEGLKMEVVTTGLKVDQGTHVNEDLQSGQGVGVLRFRFERTGDGQKINENDPDQKNSSPGCR